MTPSKAKEIIDRYGEYLVKEFKNEPSVDKWLATPEAAALLSGEDWKESQWEYSVRPALADWDLGELGKEGWQLCAVNDKYYYFKRPLPESPKP